MTIEFTNEERAMLFPIVLREYNPAYPQWFAEEKANIERLVGAENILRISHIGSTAVLGLLAKPTVDILLEITDNADVEALIAAVYLDGGLDAAGEFVERHILSPSGGVESGATLNDWKTELQELVQRRSGLTLNYCTVSESGPEHNKLFASEVQINGEPAGRGTGRSKKEAEQAAARKALEAFGD